MRRACVLPWRSLAVPDFMSDPSPSSGALEKAQIPAYAAQLNAPQRDAVLTTEGPVLMLAGAGTGKTAALTARLAHLIATRRAWPSEILCVTFTNKAAREMRERVGRHIGDAVEGMPWLGTFHSIGARMLRRHAELVGNGELHLKPSFTILDTDVSGGVNDGLEVAGVPNFQANIGAEVIPPFFDALTITSRLVHTGSQWANTSNTAELDSWTRFDLGARYVAVLGDHPVTFRVFAENVFDNDYWYSAYNGYLLQGQPRTLRASVTFEY